MPRPRRKKGETEAQYRQRLVRHYIDEGYPPKQAVAIAYSVMERQKEKKSRKKRNK
jgi:hypothetical protein